MANKSYKTFFMPLLCRFSLNDTVQPPKLSNSSTTDPSSPKLTCIGQIKKKSTTATVTTARSSGHSNRYTKLHKLFSGRNLISPAIDTGPFNKLNSKSVTSVCNINNAKYVINRNNSYNRKSVTNRSKSRIGRNRVPINKKKCYVSSDDLDLDPPLPVVKCCRRDQESNVNLWKRRGIEVKSLQIQLEIPTITMADLDIPRRQQRSDEVINW